MTIPNHHLSARDGVRGGVKPQILIIDDSNVARTFIRVILQNDFDVHEASDGSQAIEMEQKKEGMTVDRLLEKARAGENIQVEMQYYDPVDLLALFMKKCFGLVGLVAPVEKVAAIVITVDKPDEETMNIFKKAVDILRIKPDKIYFQSHSESAYYYMINQPRELWNHNVLICHLKSDCLVIRTMKKNVHTSPVVVLMEENKFRNVRGGDRLYSVSLCRTLGSGGLLQAQEAVSVYILYCNTRGVPYVGGGTVSDISAV